MIRVRMVGYRLRRAFEVLRGDDDDELGPYMSYAEAMERLTAIGFGERTREVSAESWREAVLRKMPEYPEGFS